MTVCLLDRTAEPVDAQLQTWGELLQTLDVGLESTHRVVLATASPCWQRVRFRWPTPSAA
jgi:hypothetical protein